MPPTQTVPFVRSSPTSRAAATSLKQTAKVIQSRILRTIAKAPLGLTCAEIEEYLPLLRQSTVSARVRDLKTLGHITAMGTRKTPRGRDADVLVVTALGRKAVSL